MIGKFRPYTVFGKSWDNPDIRRRRSSFNDSRYANSFHQLSDRFVKTKAISIQKLALNKKEADRYYSFLKSPRVSIEETIQMNCSIRPEVVENREVLHIGDTTTYNLSKRKGRISDIEKMGLLQDWKTPGFFLHAGMALDAKELTIIGMVDMQIWGRHKAGSKAIKHQPDALAAKDSYKWHLGSKNASTVLQGAKQVTHLYDCEADIFDLMREIIEKLEDQLIIRSYHNRQIIWNGVELRLDECLSQSTSLGEYEIELRALNHYSWTAGKQIIRKARKAVMELRAELVEMMPPAKSDRTKALQLYMVEAKEITANLPKDEEAVCWRIWTTHEVDSFEGAKKIVDIYTKRWMIEQLFRTTKKKGFNQEATELETTDAILKQTAMVTAAACKVLQLVYARNKYKGVPIDDGFDHEQQEVLKKLNVRLQGNTEQQKNPFPIDQLSWAAWVIARLGGWKGYQSQRPPGPLTMKYGLERFYTLWEGYRLVNSP